MSIFEGRSFCFGRTPVVEKMMAGNRDREQVTIVLVSEDGRRGGHIEQTPPSERGFSLTVHNAGVLAAHDT